MLIENAAQYRITQDQFEREVLEWSSMGSLALHLAWRTKHGLRANIVDLQKRGEFIPVTTRPSPDLISAMRWHRGPHESQAIAAQQFELSETTTELRESQITFHSDRQHVTLGHGVGRHFKPVVTVLDPTHPARAESNAILGSGLFAE